MGKMERLPFPQKTDVKVMLLGKNSEAVRTKRIVELVRRPLPSPHSTMMMVIHADNDDGHSCRQ